MWVALIFGGTAALFLGWALSMLWHLRWVRRLPPLEDQATPASARLTRCSVIIAARNEEARIEKTIRCLFAQRGLDLEIIVVDDRSTDRTGEILQRLGKEDARLQVKRVDALPDGWLGKCHACHVGASAATSDWILFTDADCWLKPDVVARALGVADRHGADHITMTCGIAESNLGLRAWHLLFLVSLANWLSGVNRNRPKSYVGLGAFNLVCASAYRECGGYEALRLTVLDDVKLGLLIRRVGGSTRAFLGADDVVCHWGAKMVDMIKIMEKNYFATLEFRVWLALAVAGFVSLLIAVAVLGLLSQTAAGTAAALAPLAIILPAAILARRVGWPWWTALGVPFAVPVIVCALLNSIWVTLRQGGIRWRDTFYSLKTLRAGGVR